MVVHLFLALSVSIRWRLLFPTLCWSINTKSIVRTTLSVITLPLNMNSYGTNNGERSVERPQARWSDDLHRTAGDGCE
jgi:hypothetical protein